MPVPSIDNTYALLALFLSPWKDYETVQALAEVVHHAKVDWESLLYMANLHRCTPLWLVRLRNDGLLSFLPPELRAYLIQLHHANVERNEMFRKAAKEVLRDLQNLDIPAILLKGAATFCDDLYGDLGARMMADIDLLVKQQHLESVRSRLFRLGYHEQPSDHGHFGYFGSYAPHHLPRFVKPGTPVVVEVHFQTAPGQAGRVLQTNLSWKHSSAEICEGLPTFVLAPSYRLLHNTVHALVPFQQFVSSTVLLTQLAEFAYLVLRYGSAIDWLEWLGRGKSQGLGGQFRVYLNLAHGLMAMPLPTAVPRIHSPRMRAARMCVAANWRASFYGHGNLPASGVERAKWFAIAIWVFVYSRLTRPVWLWHNFCYKEGVLGVPVRLLCLVAFLANDRISRRLLDIRKYRVTVRKIASLLKKPSHLQA